MKFIRSHYFALFLTRMALLFLVFGICRFFFAIHNWDIVGPVAGGDVWSVLKGSFVFDSASIFYINIPFIFFSLVPFRFRERQGYQKFLLWVFVICNGLGIMVDIADIFYFPFKLSRIASDDLHFLTEGNFGALTASFLGDFWPGLSNS